MTEIAHENENEKVCTNERTGNSNIPVQKYMDQIITGVMYVEKYTCIPVKKHGTVYTFQKNYMIVLTYRYQQVVL